MKKHGLFICLFVFLFVLYACSSQMPVFCFFSSVAQIKGEIGVGNLDVEVVDIKVGGIEIEAEEKDSVHGVLKINTAALFSFTVRNIGTSDAEYTLDFQIAWDEELPEAGKVFLYPSDIADEDIYENLINSDYTGSLFAADVSDSAKINGSAGVTYGISVTVAFRDVLAASYSGLDSKSFEYKLLFYADKDIAADIGRFQNKTVEVGIVLYTDVLDRQTQWASSVRRFFRLESIIGLAQPVITEIAGPKTFFVTQTQNLSLESYAAAYDELEKDITNKIEITSYPAFDPDKAGKYNVTYIVKNSSGVYSDPLQITIVIWDFVKLESGSYHTLALTSHGKVYAWGRNSYGQLGIGNNSAVTGPTLIGTLSDIVGISAGQTSSFAVDAAGRAYAWGRNLYGALGIGDENVASVNSPVQIASPEGVLFKQISSCEYTVGALTNEGEVYTWGYGGYGTLGSGSLNDRYDPVKLTLTHITQISIGQNGAAAVTKDGMLYTWGNNTFGQLGNGTTMNSTIKEPAQVPYFADRGIRIKSIGAGYAHMAAVSEDGRLFTWGSGDEGRLGNGFTANKNTPQEIEMPAAVTKAIAGYADSAAITEDGRVFFFGYNNYGKHGSGDTANHLTPYLLENVTDVTDVSVANDTSFVLKQGRTVYGMGSGSQGLLPGSINSMYPELWAFVPPQPY